MRCLWTAMGNLLFWQWRIRYCTAAEMWKKALDGDVIVGNIPVKFPIVDEPLTLKIMASVGTADYNDVYVWQKYEEMTGINVDWVQMQGSEKGEKIAAALSTGDYADLIFRCRLSQETLTEYGEQGLIVDLNENNMLETYAPNTWNYLQTHPDTLASVMSPDGKIYSLPQVNSGAELRVSRKLFINKKWLENVNMEVPATTEELYQVLKAFKEQDANGNGDPDDDILPGMARWSLCFPMSRERPECGTGRLQMTENTVFDLEGICN